MLDPAAPGMALPSVRSVVDCGLYSTTFEPFLPHMYALPQRIWESIGDLGALKDIYLTTNPAIFGLALSIGLMPVFFVVAEINKNHSQVDRVWSIVPALFNVHYAIWARLNGLETERLNSVALFSVAWSARLTYNYWRRGGYNIGSEDYRWELIKKYIGSFGFLLLNIFFISTVQLVLLWAVSLPTYVLLLTSQLRPEIAAFDQVFSRLLVALVVFEWFADGQQWNYHQAKQEYQKTAKVPEGWTRAQVERGFNTTGLWKHSRHPNFAAEQFIWIVLYQWGCFKSETLWNYTCAGVIGYVLVFAGSTPITEWISGGKYPEYKLYQKRVGKFIPSLFGAGWNEEEAEKAAKIQGKKQ